MQVAKLAVGIYRLQANMSGSCIHVLLYSGLDSIRGAPGKGGIDEPVTQVIDVIFSKPNSKPVIPVVG